MIVATNKDFHNRGQFLVQIAHLSINYFVMLRWKGKKLVCSAVYSLIFDTWEPRLKYLSRNKKVIKSIISLAKVEVYEKNKT